MSKGFWIPIDLLHDKNTTMQEKFILVEISQLSMLDKGCIASNSHFSQLLKVKKESISRSISSLENKGYISTKIKEGSRNHERTITINKMLFEYKQNVIDPLTNCLETKENKTINKTNKRLIDIFFNENEGLKRNYVTEGMLEDFIEYRKNIKKPIKTTNALKGFYNNVKDLISNGFDITKCLEEMKIKEWQTINKEYVKNRNDLKATSNQNKKEYERIT